MKFIISLLTVMTVASIAQALPLPKGQQLLSLPENFTAEYNFEGIVGLDNCSGSLIRFENSRDTDSAMVMTNGHCLEAGFPKPGTYLYGKPSRRSFRLFNERMEVVGRLTATTIIYGTMTKTDMAIYKLSETYADIKSKYSVNALTLSSQRPTERTPMEVISGYWKRGYSCEIEAFIPQLKEAGFTWEDSIRYSRPGCQVIGGTSGSPIIQKGTRTVIGINNTGNESGYMCEMNNPCEVDKDGNQKAYRGYSYGEQTYWVYSCLNQYNEIDVNVPGCQLFH
ncbi:trypsin-like serine peptidase [Bdellovibrio sp. HCB209]|uniref:trypsin-like serine peptidase n=1 Tax=Bdellovibrio sp. HCB209 TaxID=3394354 RepID=UPI0039B4A4D8